MRTVALALVLCLFSPVALAQEGKKCGEDSGKSGKGNYEVVVGADGKKIYRMKKAFVLCGTVPKPSVLYGLLNTNINYEWENLKQDFLHKVLRSVEQKPF